MLFNSFDFVLFFIIVIFIYNLINKKRRWLLLLIASWIYYTYRHPEYFLLILSLSLMGYLAGVSFLKIKEQKTKRTIFIISIILILFPLFLFKYSNFFFLEFHRFLAILGIQYHIKKIAIGLPLGISFFTFQTLSYVIDVYRKHIEPETHFGIFFTFIAFFPKLLAGPIEKAGHFLPQIKENIEFDYQKAIEGLRLILLGLFMKVVIADRLGIYVDQVFDNYHNHHGLAILIATYFFSFQIYCDFAGYSAIAIGTARVLGFQLMTNFNYPYLSASIKEFWRRWHISLSIWLRDYLFLPLAYFFQKRLKSDRLLKIKSDLWTYMLAISITWILCGLWHGANWTFVLWGGIHGFFLVGETVKREFKKNRPKIIHFRINKHLKQVLSVAVVFHLVLFSWIFFRARSVSQAISMIHVVTSDTFFSRHQNLLAGLPFYEFIITTMLLIGFTIVEIVSRFHLVKPISDWSRKYRWAFYYIIILLFFLFGEFGERKFIYNQF